MDLSMVRYGFLVALCQLVATSQVLKLPLHKLTVQQTSIDVTSEYTFHSDVRVKRQATSDEHFNMLGAPGAGYAVEVLIGTPAQRVGTVGLIGLVMWKIYWIRHVKLCWLNLIPVVCDRCSCSFGVQVFV